MIEDALLEQETVQNLARLLRSCDSLSRISLYRLGLGNVAQVIAFLIGRLLHDLTGQEDDSAEVEQLNKIYRPAKLPGDFGIALETCTGNLHLRRELVVPLIEIA